MNIEDFATPYGNNGDLLVAAEYFAHCPVQTLGHVKDSDNKWSWSSGGWGLRDYQWTIDIFRRRPEVVGDLAVIRWVLPESLSSLLQSAYENGKHYVGPHASQHQNNLSAGVGRGHRPANV